MVVKIISTILINLVIIFTITLKIIIAPHLCKVEKSDVIVILGCNLNSIFMNQRLKKSIELYNEGIAKYFIVTGKGKGDISEALGMKNFLVNLGIYDNNIFIEEKAKNTYQNLKFSKNIMNNKGFKKAVIVSDYYHIARIKMIAKRIKLDCSFATWPVKKFNKYEVKAILREVIAYIKDFIIVYE